MGYKKLIQEAYKKYVKNWCEARGYSLEDIDLETGINGECYVCINEFEQNEFQNEEYMAKILTDTEFGMWQDRHELKNILLQSLISRIYFRQKAGHFSKCPRCGNKMDPKLSHNAFSRRADVYVCSSCGTLEAIEDAPCPPFDKVPKKPIGEWDFAHNIEFELD